MDAARETKLSGGLDGKSGVMADITTGWGRRSGQRLRLLGLFPLSGKSSGRGPCQGVWTNAQGEGAERRLLRGWFARLDACAGRAYTPARHEQARQGQSKEDKRPIRQSWFHMPTQHIRCFSEKRGEESATLIFCGEGSRRAAGRIWLRWPSSVAGGAALF